MTERIGILVRTESAPRVLHQLTGVIADHGGDIISVDIIGAGMPEPRVYFEITLPEAPDALVTELGATTKKDMGRVMKELKTRHGSAIDGKLASTITGELLK